MSEQMKTPTFKAISAKQAMVLLAIHQHGTPYGVYRRVRHDTMAALRNAGLIAAFDVKTVTYPVTDAGRDWLRQYAPRYGVDPARVA